MALCTFSPSQSALHGGLKLFQCQTQPPKTEQKLCCMGPAFISRLWIFLDSNHLDRLCHTVGKYRPCIQTHKTSPPQHASNSLHACKYVFVRNDAQNDALPNSYHGPYAVLEHRAGRNDWVSIDCLKLFYLEDKANKPITSLVDHPTQLCLFLLYLLMMNLVSPYLRLDGQSVNLTDWKPSWDFVKRSL
ncbi:hypothetical protein Pcinc_000573 [Petrolisthes cinctipes]|uniref:Uncharacterized protein n=1 Tax=Petrolisthes cinctipes TaxID=88211 RepID=A0AAE1GMW4_PETCI|nr:hypothetical protein Pcinc_000573 [Petrolisthes cinctipes]